MNFDFIEDMASVGKTFPPVQSLPVLLRYRYRKRWWVAGWEGCEVRLSVCPVSCGSRLPPVFLPVYRYR
jgi:hypothetical protein